MAINFEDIATKAATMKAAAAKVKALAEAINTGTIAGVALHADTLNTLRTVEGPAARTEANDAWDALNAAMTP